MKNLLIMGPQGSGKGTQAKFISEHFSIPAISTGDIFRYNIKNNTELGKQANEYIKNGDLVPDSLTNAILFDALKGDSAKNGFLLDGYPRNIKQVKALDEMLEKLNTSLDAVVLLEVDRDVLIDRMIKRAAIEHREDDNEEAIKNRLAIYDKETSPLAEEYEKRNLLIRVNGVGEIEKISAEIISALEKF